MRPRSQGVIKPQVPTSYFVAYTIFNRKGTPSLPSKNCTPLTYLFKNFAFVSTAVKALPFKYEYVGQNRNVFVSLSQP